jgi:hypothetical protein
VERREDWIKPPVEDSQIVIVEEVEIRSFTSEG